MQSSNSAAFRLVVMLACVVVLPAYALLGTSLPQKLVPLVERLVGSNGSAVPASADAEASSGRMRGGAAQTTAESSQRPDSWALAPPWPPKTEPPPVRPRDASWPSGEQGNIQAVYQQPVGSASLRREPPESPRTAAGPRLVSHHPAGRELMVQDRFRTMELALDRLGAVRFSLEMENRSGQQRYWCTCEVRNFHRPFESSGADALSAMAGVLRQVEAWRAERVARLP